MSTNYTAPISFKALNGQINIDEAQGIVECFVAAVGNKDSVGDVVATGAFTESLKRRKPRVVWGHSWNDPIGKVLEIYEVPVSDPRLPAKMKQAGVGGLFAKVQFNLATEKGREAFSSVAFFGHEQEWSIGYKTLNATFDPGSQANILHEVELYEVSPVLHGANQLTGTISVKSDEGEKCAMPTVGSPAPRSGPAIVGRPIFPQAISPVQAPVRHRNQYREDIFGEGEARILPDEARNALALELMSRSRSQLDIVHATENSVTFNRDAGNGNSTTYRLSYHRDEDTGEYMFGKPEKIGMRNEQSTMPSTPVVVPSQMPSMRMNVKPGSGVPTGMMFLASGGKSLDDAMDEASELLIDVALTEPSMLPADKLQYAIDLLQSVAGAKQDPAEEEVFSVLCSPDEAFQVKSLLDPVIEYHRLDAEVDNQGIHISNGLTPDAISALEAIAFSIDDVLYGGVGGSKK
jgi:HK97 family phage prohead protease